MSVNSSRKNDGTPATRQPRSKQDWATVIELLRDEDSLNDVGLQGLMYLLKVGKGLPLSYEFEMRLSGPHSTELLEDVQRLVSFRVLARREGRYFIGDSQEITRLRDALSAGTSETISHLVKSLDELPPPQRTLLPTILLALRTSREKDSDRLANTVAAFVSSVRPTLLSEDVQGALKALPSLVSDSEI
jgi:hypothetical protein